MGRRTSQYSLHFPVVCLTFYMLFTCLTRLFTWSINHLLYGKHDFLHGQHNVFFIVIYLFHSWHRERTILLNRKRVNKGMKRTNSLPLSPAVVISNATLQRKPLPQLPASHT